MIKRLGIPGLLPVFLEAALGAGGGNFVAPLKIPVSPLGGVWVSAGDFNRDGSLDLAVVDGRSQISIFLQDPSDRDQWIRQESINLGLSNFCVLAADWDQDGDADLVLADTQQGAYFLRSRGDGTFEKGTYIEQTGNSRVVVTADFTGDGVPDLAATNNFNSFSVHRGGGDGSFTYLGSYPALNVHDMVTLDYDADGKPDIMVKTKETGIFPFQGRGDGSFRARPLIANLAVRGPIAAAEFNHDGKGDLLTGYGAGISQGDSSYRKVLDYERPFAPVGAADFSGDGNQDAAVVNQADGVLEVYPGNGDGSFGNLVTFRLPGSITYFTSQDLDGDGRADLVAVADTSAISIFWGKEGAQFLASATFVADTGPSKAMALGDLDRDGAPDLFFAGSAPGARVVLRPGRNAGDPVVLPISTQNGFSILEAVDLDGDQVLDLAGANFATGNLVLALLTSGGDVRGESTLFAGAFPSDLIAGRIDGDSTLDLAVVSKGSNHVAIFLGQAGGTFSPARNVPTLDKPRATALGDLDGDEVPDLAVISNAQIAVHYGLGDGSFSEPTLLPGGARPAYADIVLSNLDEDGWLDIAAADATPAGIRIWRNKTGRRFEPLSIRSLDDPPSALAVADLNGDGRADLVSVSAEGKSSSVLLNQGAFLFARPVSYSLSLAPLDQRMGDLDGNGALDLVGFDSREAVILFGIPSSTLRDFRRGDVTGEGILNISDPIYLLAHLFQGGGPLGCVDAADANDDGKLDLADPVSILRTLFLGGGPLPMPGPACGPDPTEDTLAACAAACP